MRRLDSASSKLIFGLVLLGLLTLVFMLGPALVDADLGEQDLTRRNQPPSMQSFFGTDELGRDLFVRISHGGRQSLITAFAAGLTALFLGTGIGAVAGFSRRLDSAVIQIVDLIVSISNWTLVLVVAPWFLRLPGGVGVLFGIASSDRIARVVRAQTQSMISSDVISAAIISGSTTVGLLRRHFWPRLSGVVAAELVFVMALSSAFEATLAFLQFGDQLSLGLALHDAKGSVSDEPSRVLIPAVLLIVILLAFYLVGRGITQLRPGGMGQQHGGSARA